VTAHFTSRDAYTPPPVANGKFAAVRDPFDAWNSGPSSGKGVSACVRHGRASLRSTRAFCRRDPAPQTCRL